MHRVHNILKKIAFALFAISFFCLLHAQPASIPYFSTIEQYKSLNSNQLLDIADKFYANNSKDSALICYSLIYNNNAIKKDTVLVQALNRAALIYYSNYDYKTSLELFLRALKIAEDIGYNEYVGRIYNNIGNIYNAFKDLSAAENCYRIAYEKKGSDQLMAVVLLNLGVIAGDKNELDSAMMFFRKAYTMRKQSDAPNMLYDILNNMAVVYLRKEQYDSALYYYNLSLENVRQFNLESHEAKFLQNIAEFYYNLKSLDSAIYYLNKSNELAEKAKSYDVLSGNYFYLSQIEEQRGNKSKALEYHHKFYAIKDSIFNASKYAEINQMQFLYDMAKVDKQIQELNAERELKERMIVFQRTIQWILISAFLIVLVVLLYIYLQKQKLNQSYKVLVSKNIEIVNQDSKYKQQIADRNKVILNLEEELSRFVQHRENKYQATSISRDLQHELKEQILEIMSDASIICNSDFTINTLAEIVKSNRTYISKIINQEFHKNFNSFINEYRIKEALKMLQAEDYQKYTVEGISKMVGFESRSTFNIAFKEITGVTPTFYIKSLQSSTLQNT
ncbi:MAG: tetratricopeptide repeat protein [Bacteroidetes bacterium]|nr:tetratricopeptide repeat protein [Bacteroidota bacterium]MCL2301825.1 tetratricopeptide repeat protein [Lentimicrobiaceae bacterium]